MLKAPHASARRRTHGHALYLETDADVIENGQSTVADVDALVAAAGRPELLEVDPNPGWCWDGKMSYMAQLAGWSSPDLPGRILRAARERVRAEAERAARIAPVPSAAATRH